MELVKDHFDEEDTAHFLRVYGTHRLMLGLSAEDELDQDDLNRWVRMVGLSRRVGIDGLREAKSKLSLMLSTSALRKNLSDIVAGEFEQLDLSPIREFNRIVDVQGPEEAINYLGSIGAGGCRE